MTYLIEEYIDRHEADHVIEVLYFLHQYMLDADVHMTASLKWRIPFYSRRKNLAYLNVVDHKSAVELNFYNARFFDDDVKSLLDFRSRKQIAGIIYRSVSEIDLAALDVVIHEALRIDDL